MAVATKSKEIAQDADNRAETRVATQYSLLSNLWSFRSFPRSVLKADTRKVPPTPFLFSPFQLLHTRSCLHHLKTPRSTLTTVWVHGWRSWRRLRRDCKSKPIMHVSYFSLQRKHFSNIRSPNFLIDMMATNNTMNRKWKRRRWGRRPRSRH